MSIQCRVLGFEPLEHESPPITTRPGVTRPTVFLSYSQSPFLFSSFFYVSLFLSSSVRPSVCVSFFPFHLKLPDCNKCQKTPFPSNLYDAIFFTHLTPPGFCTHNPSSFLNPWTLSPLRVLWYKWHCCCVSILPRATINLNLVSITKFVNLFSLPLLLPLLSFLFIWRYFCLIRIQFENFFEVDYDILLPPPTYLPAGLKELLPTIAWGWFPYLANLHINPFILIT